MTWHLLLRRSYGVRLVPVMLLMWWYGAFGNPPARSAIERASSILYAFMMVAGPVALSTCLELRRFTEGQILKRLSKVSAENCGAVVGNCCSSFYNSCRRFRSAFRIWGSNCKNVVDWCCLDARVGCLWRRDWNVMAIGIIGTDGSFDPIYTRFVWTGRIGTRNEVSGWLLHGLL